MPKQYIIFKTESLSSPGWEDRSLAHTGTLTSLLAEHYNYAEKPLPQPGDRLREFACFETSEGSNLSATSTHVRWGDWEVARVERFKAIDESKYDEIAICYCRYRPIESAWKELQPVEKPASGFVNAIAGIGASGEGNISEGDVERKY